MFDCKTAVRFKGVVLPYGLYDTLACLEKTKKDRGGARKTQDADDNGPEPG